MTTDTQVVVVGAGIVGLATAHALGSADVEVVVLDKEARIATHQSGRNSGVIHSGIYYRPGSVKARLCRSGREALVAFCRDHGIAHEVCGKVIVATRSDQLDTLAELERRGAANGVTVRRLDPGGLREREPHATGVAALEVAEAGIVDFPAVAGTLGHLVRERGGVVELSRPVHRIRDTGDGVEVDTDGGRIRALAAVNCAGLHADRLARASGVTPPVRIVPFRGEYYELAPSKTHLVRHLIYPVPDPRFPFLGVHLTRMVHGGVHAGPNAVLALAREGYRWRDIEPAELAELLGYRGVWRLARRYWRTGLDEVRRSLSRERFARALAELVPGIGADDLRRAPAGVRAQAVRPDGTLVDDFEIVRDGRTVHVLNAPSPAATASLAIGAHIASEVAAVLS